ncbi:unnamed protein product [Caenorhabditis auriculariae]|uniref:Uncharacterized protein n=1 Tax=Caenorhabditis auriculariae TaxID=2777116 RepID=A0A8S1GQR0_9PELO|nr:unnamed protein product [Caenorhabditis auriculariae]
MSLHNLCQGVNVVEATEISLELSLERRLEAVELREQLIGQIAVLRYEDDNWKILGREDGSGRFLSTSKLLTGCCQKTKTTYNEQPTLAGENSVEENALDWYAHMQIQNYNQITVHNWQLNGMVTGNGDDVGEDILRWYAYLAECQHYNQMAAYYNQSVTVANNGNVVDKGEALSNYNKANDLVAGTIDLSEIPLPPEPYPSRMGTEPVTSCSPVRRLSTAPCCRCFDGRRLAIPHRARILLCSAGL